MEGSTNGGTPSHHPSFNGSCSISTIHFFNGKPMIFWKPPRKKTRDLPWCPAFLWRSRLHPGPKLKSGAVVPAPAAKKTGTLCDLSDIGDGKTAEDFDFLRMRMRMFAMCCRLANHRLEATCSALDSLLGIRLMFVITN